MTTIIPEKKERIQIFRKNERKSEIRVCDFPALTKLTTKSVVNGDFCK